MKKKRKRNRSRNKMRYGKKRKRDDLEDGGDEKVQEQQQ